MSIKKALEQAAFVEGLLDEARTLGKRGVLDEESVEAVHDMVARSEEPTELQPGDVVSENGVPIGIVQGILSGVGESISVGPDSESGVIGVARQPGSNELVPYAPPNFVRERHPDTPVVVPEVPDALTELATRRKRKIRKPRAKL